MTFRGTIAAINTALNGLTFTPTTSFAGLAQLTVLTNDLGNTGSGGALTDSDSFSIHVGALVVTNSNDLSNSTVTSIAALVANDGGDGIFAARGDHCGKQYAGTDYISFNIAGAGVPPSTSVAPPCRRLRTPCSSTAGANPATAARPVIRAERWQPERLERVDTGRWQRRQYDPWPGHQPLRRHWHRDQRLEQPHDPGQLDRAGQYRHDRFRQWREGHLCDQQFGILIGTDADGNSDANERNVISGNAEQGIYFDNVDNSTIAGNYIGTDVLGTGDVTGTGVNAAQSGVLGNDSDGNVIGGPPLRAQPPLGTTITASSPQQHLTEQPASGQLHRHRRLSGLVALGNPTVAPRSWGARQWQRLRRQRDRGEQRHRR